MLVRTSASIASALVLSVLGLAGDPDGCAGSGGDERGVNAPCTRDRDCGSGLSCVEGVCTSDDAGAPEPPADAGAPEPPDDASVEAGP